MQNTSRKFTLIGTMLLLALPAHATDPAATQLVNANVGCPRGYEIMLQPTGKNYTKAERRALANGSKLECRQQASAANAAPLLARDGNNQAANVPIAALANSPALQQLSRNSQPTAASASSPTANNLANNNVTSTPAPAPAAAAAATATNTKSSSTQSTTATGSVAEQLQAALQKGDREAVRQLIASNSANTTEAGSMARTMVLFARENAGSNPAAMADTLGELGNLCGGSLNAADAQNLARELRALVQGLREAAAKGENLDEYGSMLASAMSCAGQPAIVAVDPELYGLMMADASQMVLLARGERSNQLGQLVQFARQTGLRPNNNQIPTVTQSVD